MTTGPIVFLDVDGVLNSHGSWIALGAPSKGGLDPVAVGLVRKLCDETDARIVLSSTWRLGGDLLDVKQRLARAGAPQLCWLIVDRTPDFAGLAGFDDGHRRGREIHSWRHGTGHRGPFVIIDDDADMLPEQLPHFVQTTFANGFRVAEYARALRILKPDHPDCDQLLCAIGAKAEA